MTFSHNSKDDTILERDGNDLDFTFWSDTFTYEDPDTMTFHVAQADLFKMMEEFFDTGDHADLFEGLSLPAQDALWNALLFLDKNGIVL